MKFAKPALQLLALCQLAAASPCRPSSSVSSIAPSTTTIDTVESGYSTVASETGPPSDSATPTSAPSAEPTTTLEATADSTTLLDESTTTDAQASGVEPTTTLETSTDSKALVHETTTTDLLPSTLEYTTTVESTTGTFSEEPTTTLPYTAAGSTTTTAEASTTTTSTPQGPPNLVVNGGFEDGTTSPWVKVTPDGALNAVSSGKRSGNKAGLFIGEAPSSVPSTLGIKQDISASTLEAGKSYKLSAWYTLLENDCFGPMLLCGHGWQTLWPGTQLIKVAGYSQAEVTCSWTQDQLNDGPNIQIQGDCFNLEMAIDDVVLEEIV